MKRFVLIFSIIVSVAAGQTVRNGAIQFPEITPPGNPPANSLIGSCTTVSGSPCNIADAATSPTAFQANTSDLTAVIDDGSFPPSRENRFFMKEPVVFNSHLTVTATNGVNGIGFPVTNNTTYDVVSFYYTED